MPEPSQPTLGGPPPALLRAIRRVLAPLVRLLLQHQITFPILANLLKSVYVEQAEKAFALPGRPQTISRLSLLTGIHRKDVKRLQNEQPESDGAPANVSLGAELVLRWTTDEKFQSGDGHPIPLPRLAAGESGPSFEALVESVSKDIRPRAILDEWQRLGIASVDAEDNVHLATNAFVPKHGFDEKAYYLGRNLHDHIAATAHNLSGEDRPMLERSVYYAKLRSESIEDLRERSTQAGMDVLQEINLRARALQQADASHPDATHRMRLGVYFYEEPTREERDQDNETGGSDAN
jgi:hypothetical protein